MTDPRFDFYIQFGFQSVNAVIFIEIDVSADLKLNLNLMSFSTAKFPSYIKNISVNTFKKIDICLF